MSNAFFFELSARTKLRVTGADRIRFLNGQTTNDVRKSSARATQESCVLNAKGHLEAHLFLFAADDAVWIDADEELRERLPERLERYVIADDVAIADMSKDFALFHILTPSPPQIAEMKYCPSARRLNYGGWDIWCTASDAAGVRDAIAAEAQFIDPEALETRRIEDGIGRWGRELTPEIIPPEVNLQERAIDYEKGCYIGQEVISRMKMSGQMRQRLCGIIGEKELSPGMELRASGPLAGKITSAVYSERLGAHIGLSIVKRSFNAPGTELLAGNDAVRVRLTGLPLID